MILFLSINYATQRCWGSDFKAKNEFHKGSCLTEMEIDASYPGTVRGTYQDSLTSAGGRKQAPV